MAEMDNYRERKIEHSCGKLAVIEVNQADDSRPSIVYLHGWLDNAASLFPLIDAVSRRLPDVHQVAFDLPGHGLSSHKASDNFYAFHDYIDDIHQLLLRLSLKRCILVGHSLGGLISSCYSAAFPEYVAGLIQIDGVGPLGETTKNAVARLRDGVISRARIRKKPRKGYPDLDHAVAHKAKTTGLTAEQVYPMVTRGIEQRDGVWYWRADNSLSGQALYRMSSEQVVVFLKHITCPFDIIAAKDGLITQRQDLARWRPEHAVVHHVAGGHHCHIQHPDTVAEIIVSQWQQC